MRVTASEVRKRLLPHYGQYGSSSEFRISLPSGSYVPEIIREPQKKRGPSEENDFHPDPMPVSEASPVKDATPNPVVVSTGDSQKSVFGAEFSEPIGESHG